MKDLMKLGYDFGEICIAKDTDEFTEELNKLVSDIDNENDKELAKRLVAFGFGEFLINFMGGWKMPSRSKSCDNPRKSMPTRKAIQRYWIEHEPSITSTDLEELACFGCGDFYNGHYDNKKANDIPLDRAHIIPHSLGGSSSVDNIVLLCKECHREAPMYGTKEDFIGWLKRRESHINRFIRRTQEELGGLGITKEVYETCMRDNVEEFAEFYKKAKYGWHVDGLGLTVSHSTRALVIRDFFKAKGFL